MNVDKLIEHYVHLRDRKAEIEARHKDELAPLKEDMSKIEGALQKLMNDQGVKQLKGEHGTAFQQEQTSAKVVDWDKTLSFVQENERWDLLERRVNKTAALEEDVPGVEVSRAFKVNVRRS